MNTEFTSTHLVHDFLNALDNHSRGEDGMTSDLGLRLSVQCTYLETVLYRVCTVPEVQEELRKQIRDLKALAQAARERQSKTNSLVSMIAKGEVVLS